MRILIVDDQIAILEFLFDLLDKPGVRIDAAEACAQALALLDRHSYEWAVLDYRLPDGTGLDILQTIRARFPATRVVIITADADDRVLRERALALGAEDVLGKPLFADALVHRMFGPVRARDR